MFSRRPFFPATFAKVLSAKKKGQVPCHRLVC